MRPKRHDYEALLEEERLILEATEAIHRLMDDENITRTELAQRIGATKGHVSQLLDGKRNMTLRTLARLTRALGARARISTESLTRRATAPQPLRTHELYDYLYLRSAVAASIFAQLDGLSAQISRQRADDHPDIATDIDRELEELLTAANVADAA